MAIVNCHKIPIKRLKLMTANSVLVNCIPVQLEPAGSVIYLISLHYCRIFSSLTFIFRLVLVEQQPNASRNKQGYHNSHERSEFTVAGLLLILSRFSVRICIVVEILFIIAESERIIIFVLLRWFMVI